MVRRSSTNPIRLLRSPFVLPRTFFLLFFIWQGCSDTPSTPEEYLAHGDALLANGQIADAVAAYHMARHQDTLNPQVYASLSRAYAAQHKNGAADRYLRRAMNIPYDRGVRALEAGDDSLAIVAFEQTLEIFPRHPLALIKLGTIFQAHQQFEQAQLYLEQAAAANPQYKDTYIRLGQLYAMQNQPDNAKTAFNRAIELDINAFRAYIGLGQLLMDERSWQAAYEIFEKALLIDPQSPTAHSGLAKAMSNINAQSAQR